MPCIDKDRGSVLFDERGVSVAVGVCLFGSQRIFADKRGLGIGVRIPIVLVPTPKRPLQALVCQSNIRMRHQIVPKIQLVVVADISDVQVIHLVRKPVCGVSEVEFALL